MSTRGGTGQIPLHRTFCMPSIFRRGLIEHFLFHKFPQRLD